MDEFDRGGFDPEVTKFFKKIVSSFSFGMIWMLVMSIAGLYFRLALVDESVRWYNVVFYFVFLATLFVLIRYLYRTWKEG